MRIKFIHLIFLLPLCFGFRTYYSDNKWDGHSNDTSVTRKIFVSYTNGTTNIPNDLPAGDPLAGTSSITVDQAWQSIFDDFTNIGGSYVVLVSTTDSDYANSRTITISLGGASGGNSGQAQLEWSGSKVSGCTIEADSKLLDSAKDFISVMTHEIGHCMQLDHPQDTVNAIMSYFRDSDDVRLQMDDKMGLIYMFPTDTGAAKEDSTFGLSCSKR